ncbi:MAG: gamma-glutamyltransferase [Propionivibrio sp.]
MLYPLSARGGMVTAPHHLAAQAGVAILREGGNAVEATVAAAATIAVVYPHMNGIGGDGFWLIAELGCAPVAVQACGASAGLASLAYYREHGDTAIPTRGPRAALTVAGAVGGWTAALDVAAPWGKPLPLAHLLGDAIRHARDDVPVTRSQVALMHSKWPELKAVPGFAETFTANGLPTLGAFQRQPRLAATFEQLARAGFDDFYRGDLARSMAGDLEAVGSPLRLADLERYRAALVERLAVELAAGRIYNHPPPTQGVASLAILAIFERLGVADGESFAHIHGLIEATKRAFIWRNAEVGDPSRMRADPHDFLAPASLAREAAAIDRQRAAPWPPLAAPGDTVWLGAADRHGRVVSYIQSIYWEFGSGVVLPASGINWQNRGASFTLRDGPNVLQPQTLPFHTLNPALARLRDGRTLAYGTMGGEGQPQTQAAFFTRHVLYGQNLQQAITAPRWLLGARIRPCSSSKRAFPPPSSISCAPPATRCRKSVPTKT